MPRPLIRDVHEWINEPLTVPNCICAKPQPGERAWKLVRGKKTLLSLTLTRVEARRSRYSSKRQPVKTNLLRHACNTSTLVAAFLKHQERGKSRVYSTLVFDIHEINGCWQGIVDCDLSKK